MSRVMRHYGYSYALPSFLVPGAMDQRKVLNHRDPQSDVCGTAIVRWLFSGIEPVVKADERVDRFEDGRNLFFGHDEHGNRVIRESCDDPRQPCCFTYTFDSGTTNVTATYRYGDGDDVEPDETVVFATRRLDNVHASIYIFTRTAE